MDYEVFPLMVDSASMEKLPRWERGTAAVFCAAGPHPIPVTTAIRASDHRVLLTLGGRRETLRRVRATPHAALCVLTEGLAFSAIGLAKVVQEGLKEASGLAVVELDVVELVDHLLDGRTDMLSPAGWRWLDDDSAEPKVLAELERLAAAAR